jgi:ATP-binding cassette subfamily E protein 1
MEEKKNRIAVVNPDKCKPKKCSLECKKKCPANLTGKICIDVKKESPIANISETMCISCGICAKVCPFNAITIINLPKGLAKDLVHRYNTNSFKLHRLPIPRQGQVLGIVGSNGIGKSTAIKILAGKIKPNFGKYNDPPSDIEIINYFKGSELQSYFTKLFSNELVVSIKPQYVDFLSKSLTGTVRQIIEPKIENSQIPNLLVELELDKLLDRNITELSGGELQRLAIACVCSKNSDIYIFDEPSSYLDIRQRIIVAKIIRLLCTQSKYVIVVEHDLSLLDYLSDSICCLYGVPSAYGVVTMPFGVREGINIFLDGFIPTENMRFRDTSFIFRIQEIENLNQNDSSHAYYKYPSMTKTYNNKFKLNVDGGGFTNSEIIVMLGQNGTGKTSFIKMLAGITQPDFIDSGHENLIELPKFNVSYKPQMISPKYSGTVRQLFYDKIKNSFMDPMFDTDVIKPLTINAFIDNNVMELSGGELQRVALILCLGKPADIYLIDEPSAYLDSEQRIAVSKIIKQFIMHNKKTAFVVEHDFIMATYLANKIILFNGTPSIECTCSKPEKLITGMNSFLKELDITFRRDPTNFRPRINKLDSVKDKEQKISGKYFVDC